MSPTSTALPSQITFLTLSNLNPRHLRFGLQETLKHLEFRREFSLPHCSVLCLIMVMSFVLSGLTNQKKRERLTMFNSFCLWKQISAAVSWCLINCGWRVWVSYLLWSSCYSIYPGCILSSESGHVYRTLKMLSADFKNQFQAAQNQAKLGPRCTRFYK